MNETEKRFEEFIESYLVSEDGGWTKATDAGYCSDESKDMFLDIVTLTDFVKSTQPMAWKRFERMCTINPETTCEDICDTVARLKRSKAIGEAGGRYAV